MKKEFIAKLKNFFAGIAKLADAAFSKPTEKKILGKAGEIAAAKFLKSAGLRILARNFRSGRDEIDIVALDGETLVFVEVKTRNSNALVQGYYAAVEGAKRAAIRRCSKMYLAGVRKRPKYTRYDVVDIEVAPNHKGRVTAENSKIRHYQNVKL